MGPGLVKSLQACSVPKSDRLGMTNSENNVTEEAASPHFFFRLESSQQLCKEEQRNLETSDWELGSESQIGSCSAVVDN